MIYARISDNPGSRHRAIVQGNPLSAVRLLPPLTVLVPSFPSRRNHPTILSGRRTGLLAGGPCLGDGRPDLPDHSPCLRGHATDLLSPCPITPTPPRCPRRAKRASEIRGHRRASRPARRPVERGRLHRRHGCDHSNSVTVSNLTNASTETYEANSHSHLDNLNAATCGCALRRPSR